MLAACTSVKNKHPKTEFRGFWVATVVNIDWPKNGDDSVAKQKADFLRVLDFYAQMNFNTAIVQVRTAGDAFYPSAYAPWSRFLNGTEGKVKTEKIDLLNWMIDQTHKRGMEFHAWLNPYRATFDLKTEVLSPTHDFNLHPEWMVKYGKKYYYDPGNPDARHRMVQVIDEIVANFDIDAIHFDDYFYPYTIADEVFMDSGTYGYHKKPGQSLADWRRSNIDSLVKNSFETIKNRKPWVQLGISPFGVWKNSSSDPKGSDTKAGQTTYDDLYADPLLWMKNEWVDYMTPQVYWSMDLPVASHRKIVQWWSVNSLGTNLYIGNGPYKIRNNSDKAWDDKKELPKQIDFGRSLEAVSGNAFFSAKSLMDKHSDVVSYLKRKQYRYKALTPVSHLVATKTVSPRITSVKELGDTVQLLYNSDNTYRYAVLYATKKKKVEYSPKKISAIVPVSDVGRLTIAKEKLKGRKKFHLVFIDRYRRETRPIPVHLKS